MTDKADWVVYNGSLGIADKVTIGLIEAGEGGRRATLAPPYDAVGPFSLDELEAQGRIAFGACLVLSIPKWRELQDELRLEALEKRRAAMLRAAYNDQEDREVLHLPLEGDLTATEINAAFRQLAKITHPDVGGSDEDYVRITEARDALLELFAHAS